MVVVDSTERVALKGVVEEAMMMKEMDEKPDKKDVLKLVGKILRDIVEEKIPITLLGENHKVELLAIARIGIGIEHAKHIPGLCYYRHILEVKSNSEIDSIVQKSKGLIKPEKKGSKWLCDLNGADEKEITDIDKDAISNSEELLLVIESYGNMPAKEILVKAIEALGDNLDAFVKAIK